MGYITVALGVTLSVPQKGQKNYAQDFLDNFAKPISQHDHTGSGKGLTLPANAMNFAWSSSWTPNPVAITGSFGSVVIDYAKFIQLGKLVVFSMMAHGTQSSAATTGLRFTLPVNAAAGAVGFSPFHAEYSIGGALQDGLGLIYSATQGEISGADRGASTFTVGSNRYIAASGLYEAA